MAHPNGRKEIVLIIGDTSFYYLSDLIAAIRGIRRTPLAAAVGIARKQREEMEARKPQVCVMCVCLRVTLRQYRVRQVCEMRCKRREERGTEKASGAPFFKLQETSNKPACFDSGGLDTKDSGEGDIELKECPIIIFDPVGPTPSQVSVHE